MDDWRDWVPPTTCPRGHPLQGEETVCRDLACDVCAAARLAMSAAVVMSREDLVAEGRKIVDLLTPGTPPEERERQAERVAAIMSGER